MAVMKHFFHGCALTSSEIATDGICNLCHKDQAVEFACSPCNFDLCIGCSKLPQKVSHDFHPEHPLEFCLCEDDRKPRYVVCSGCGNMCYGSFYECKECKIYLDLDCALMENIFRSWDVKELLHDSHCHLLKRCRPGPDVSGSCLLCELPLSPSTICYGCVHCYWFVHERCIDITREIQHPVHPAHPLKRLNYIRTCGETFCDACLLRFKGAPFGCLECNVDLHLRCADTLLRGLIHKSHEHRLFYIPTNGKKVFGRANPCQICRGTYIISLDSYYHCFICKLKFHFECLEIPESTVKKSYHTHPLVCKVFTSKDGFVEYCGVCETMVYGGHHTYSCEECDFLGHIECILRQEVPSPLYLKDLYSIDEEIRRPTLREDPEASGVDNKILVNATKHVHGMRPVGMSELGEFDKSGMSHVPDVDDICLVCGGMILGNPFKCETCGFQSHHFCANLGKTSCHKGLHREHPDHPLTLLQKTPAGGSTNCDTCRKEVTWFNLFCRICDIIIHVSCVLEDKHFRGALHRGQKVNGIAQGQCRKKWHSLFQVTVSRSYPAACTICDERVCGNVVSCMECGEIYHPQCIEAGTEDLLGHPFHPFHVLEIKLVSGSMCTACKLDIPKYGHNCDLCDVSFHTKCIIAVDVSGNVSKRPWEHSLYNFWIDTSRVTQACRVCGKPCGASFYGCLCCKFSAHVECLGFPTHVKNKVHQHTVELSFNSRHEQDCCSLCGAYCDSRVYYCHHCEDVFHVKCLMSTDEGEAATEEEQLRDIYLMYIESQLLYMLGKKDSHNYPDGYYKKNAFDGRRDRQL